jgi:hypothetical protein
VLLGARSEHHWLRMCYARLGHLCPYLPKQPGYHKRLKAAAPLLAAAVDHLARQSPGWHDPVRLIDATTARYQMHLVRPDRRDETPRHGSIGWIRQWIEAIIWTLNVSIAHCAFFPSGVLEESSLAGFYLDTQAAAASAADMDGGEFATLDLMQNGLPGDAEGGGGLLQR